MLPVSPKLRSEMTNNKNDIKIQSVHIQIIVISIVRYLEELITMMISHTLVQ